jgi:gamma-tubulin complex component 2
LEYAFDTSPQFTLQKLWFHVHPSLHTLSLLYLLTSELAAANDPGGSESDSESSSSSDPEEEARNEALGLGGAGLKAVLKEYKSGAIDNSNNIPVKGGEVLAILYERKLNMSGDPAANRLYGKLMQAAGRPYVDMVLMWISTGRLIDPHEEQCVKESKFIDRGTLEVDYTDEYWERRYTVRNFVSLSVFISHSLDLATRRVDIRRIIKTPSGRYPSATNSRWTHARRRVRTAFTGEVET